MTNKTPDRLITIKEILKLLGVSQATLYKWIEDGHFPRAMAFGGRTRRWWRSEVLEWIAEREVETRGRAHKPAE